MARMAKLTIEIPFPDEEGGIEEAVSLAELIEHTALSSFPGEPSPAGILPVPVGRVTRVEIDDEIEER